ncbi:phage tail tape measure C-terminal domain-containing protein [Escherichia coli]
MFDGMTDALGDFVTTGKANFSFFRYFRDFGSWSNSIKGFNYWDFRQH